MKNSGEKRCSKCGEVKILSMFYTDKSRKCGKAVYCKDCMQKYDQDNKERKRAYMEKYRKDNYELLKEKHWSDKEKNNARSRKHDRLRRKNLTDAFIANQFFKSKVSEVPKELIELKRAQLRLKRECLNPMNI